MASIKPSKRLVILCDGTWCGRETNTQSNIFKLASMIGPVQYLSSPSTEPTAVHPIRSPHPNVTAGYQEGIGLNKTFLEYLWDGTTASTIAEECVSVYKFIVDNYTDDHEIWLFGLSRGAYTVRCVAGMVNNCGIIKKQPSLSTSDISTLCEEVYRTYRSPLDIDHPSSDRCKYLRNNSKRVWPVESPVKFMGLFDTVGSLGIPRLNAGIGFDWPEFYDQKVSSVVQHVHHAVGLHDRLWIFQPCLAFPSKSHGEDEAKPWPKIHQKWFPGTHYDLGRQAFRFIRHGPANALEKLLGTFPDLLSKTIYPNHVLADLVLRWMLESIASHDTDNLIIPDITSHIGNINKQLAFPSSIQPVGPTGSGDVYGDVLSYGPAGSLFTPLMQFGSKAVSLLNHVVPKLGDNIQDLLGIKTILRILTAVRDRRVPEYRNGYGGEGDVYPYKETESVQVAGIMKQISILQQARIAENSERGEVRYPSQTFERWVLWWRVFGGQRSLL
ncbi:hypothetical protein K469DRAFT_549222 [Zopfia rhizophila CBS 207.26]|uniref:T6SS Phospholipase effector Tle1-like catalytic domain-containing protein n=1 Tax=Zopfia rhizophila CBS 207.26 TaxID=1314779 RepID=A0A6A6EVK1_9PEZI|nr:hypothetical protein K469DRAFT_549222 [Zopfia rhizophila CBS 207.26]